MNDEEKKQIINFNCKYQDLMLTRYNIISNWYLAIKLTELKTFLKCKNILKISYKDLTKYDWKN